MMTQPMVRMKMEEMWIDSLVAFRVSYRVWRRHSLDHLLAVAIQVVLIGSDRRVRARLHQLRQAAERQWCGRAWTQFQVWFGTRGVGQTGCGHWEKEIIGQWLNRLIAAINYFLGAVGGFRGNDNLSVNYPIRKIQIKINFQTNFAAHEWSEARGKE